MATPTKQPQQQQQSQGTPGWLVLVMLVVAWQTFGKEGLNSYHFHEKRRRRGDYD